MAVTEARPTAPEEIDLSSVDFWALPAPEREAAFARLRRECPISWNRPADSVLLAPEATTPGYWAVVRYDDVRAISRDHRTFRSGAGVMMDEVPQEYLDASQSFLAMDQPRHTKVRGLVSAAFTPRQVRRIEEQIRDGARLVVDDVAGLGECEFVDHVAKRLPLMLFSHMVGVPEAEREPVVHAADLLVSWNDPEIVGDRQPLEMMVEGLMTLTGAARQMADERRRSPTDDLMTALVQADLEGEQLTDEEIGAFFVLMSVAGNDTTRHATSHAMRALTEFPDQRALLMENLDGRVDTAVEEFVRWASPVMTFRRNATRDTEVAGQPVFEGEKVVMFYPSANRDETAFDRADRFEVLRSPNHHAGFGGGGIHYCLGASLARSMLRAITTELLTRLPDLEAGEPEPLVGNFINGIKRMPCRFTPV